MRPARTKASTIYLRDHDRRRLRLMLRSLPQARRTDSVRDLEARLNCDDGAPPDLAPADLVTVNARFRLKHMDSGRSSVYTLKLPELSEKAPDAEGLSILDPVGAACMGRFVGCVFECQTGSEAAQFMVEEILAR